MKRTGSDSILIDKKKHTNEFRAAKYKPNDKYEIKHGNFKLKCNRCRKMTFIGSNPCKNCVNYRFVREFYNMIMAPMIIIFMLPQIFLPFYILPIVHIKYLHSQSALMNVLSLVLLFVSWLYYMSKLGNIINVFIKLNKYLVKILIIPFKGDLTMSYIDKCIRD